GDTLNFTSTALPAWLMLDAGTGILSGVAPSDASTSGPVFVTVTADDGEGGSDQLNVTITPQNAVPVVLGSAPDLQLRDGDLVSYDVAAHFADAAPDSDVLTLSVTGLPAGVSFDPITGLISGSVASQAGGSGVFAVTMTANDGQGGVVSDGFTITVGGDDLIETPDLFAAFSDMVDEEDIDEPDANLQSDLTVSGVLGVTGGTASLSPSDDVVRVAVHAIDPLRSGTDPVDDPVDVSGLSSKQFAPQFVFADGSSLLDFNNGSFLDVDPQSPLYDAVMVSATARPGLVLIELNDRSGKDMAISQVRLAVAGMEQWPSWMTMVRDKLVSVRPPQDMQVLDLKLAVVFENGQSVLKTVRVDVESGAVKTVANGSYTALDTGSKPNGSDNGLVENPDQKKVLQDDTALGDLRGALNQ
ncbi:MAG: putative Ig domain-containing protein, partial [Pseudomonadota bacterium]